jgi:GT2 family glycosyltransferase
LVTFNSDRELLERCLASLAGALRYADERVHSVTMHLMVVDNSTNSVSQQQCRQLVTGEAAAGFDRVDYWQPDGNVGFGAGHNQALVRADSDLHLIMNPDVEMAEDSLAIGIDFMMRHDDVVLVSPCATDGSGAEQYLCKRYPSLLVLALRGFAPTFVKRKFRNYLHSYEIRDVLSGSDAVDVPLASGCYMLTRTESIRRVGGFSSKFFMYFEDFDLSLRLQPVGRLVYLPDMKIVHYGGYSARKGIRHITMFAKSGWKFFRTHGWSWK